LVPRAEEVGARDMPTVKIVCAFVAFFQNQLRFFGGETGIVVERELAGEVFEGGGFV
jgi:hypothetical protein